MPPGDSRQSIRFIVQTTLRVTEPQGGFFVCAGPCLWTMKERGDPCTCRGHILDRLRADFWKIQRIKTVHRPCFAMPCPSAGASHGTSEVMEERAMSTYQDVERDIRQMANYWLLRKFQFLDWTNDVFFSYIDPHNELDELDDDKQVIMSMCFTEWLLFECPLRDGLTPLSLYLNESPIAAGFGPPAPGARHAVLLALCHS